MSITRETQSQESVEAHSPPRSQRGDWTWELVKEFPQQGDWTEEEYLSREFEGLVEYSDGVLEFLPMTTLLHQLIVDYLHSILKQFVQSRSLGVTAFAPLRVRVGEKQYREPDLVFATKSRIQSNIKPLDGADLVMEVVIDTNDGRERDLIDKRSDYASAGIPEYWIVDPALTMITVLVLENAKYKVHGDFHSGQTATSVLLPGFEIEVKSCFDAGQV
jgi:Uma2 family endonuclease